MTSMTKPAEAPKFYASFYFAPTPIPHTNRGYEGAASAQQALGKRKRGRPKGGKNKPKDLTSALETPKPKRKRHTSKSAAQGQTAGPESRNGHVREAIQVPPTQNQGTNKFGPQTEEFVSSRETGGDARTWLRETGGSASMSGPSTSSSPTSGNAPSDD